VIFLPSFRSFLCWGDCVVVSLVLSMGLASFFFGGFPCIRRMFWLRDLGGLMGLLGLHTSTAWTFWGVGVLSRVVSLSFLSFFCCVLWFGLFFGSVGWVRFVLPETAQWVK